MKFLFTGIVLLFCTFSFGQITLVKDINAGPTYGSSLISKKVTLNNVAYFLANAGAAGADAELWRSDGTTAGTYMVKDIYPGNSGSSPTSLTVFNGYVYFAATDPVNGREVWKSDGTAAGTTLLKDITPGIATSNIADLVVFNNTLFIAYDDQFRKSSIWKSDGTTAGTTLVKDINNATTYVNAERFKVSGSKLFFWASTDAAGSEPWTTDGTAAGTVMIKDVFLGSTSSHGPTVDYDFTADGNGKVYFKAAGGTSNTNRELWVSDGTNAGTVMVKDIYPGTTYASEPNSIYFFKGNLFFTATTPNSGVELWKSDGTDAGTVMVKDIAPTLYTGSNAVVLGFLKDKILVAAHDGTLAYGLELYITDGTDAGTSLLKDINPGFASSLTQSTNYKNFFTISDSSVVFFKATTAANGSELWKTDGTADGTVLIQDLEPGTTNTDPQFFLQLGNTLLFTDFTTATNAELFALDLTSLLPLDFISFTAQKCSDQQVCLKWETANEQHIAHFEIERSIDGKHFKSVGQEIAKNTLKNNYSMNDDIKYLQNNKLIYYRIKQIGKDGKSTLSNTQIIKASATTGLSIFPNPANEKINIEGYNYIKQMQLFDMSGRKMNIPLQAQSSVNTSQLANGTYILKVKMKTGETLEQKIIIQH